MTKGLFITGTDTDVGKTAVAVTILQQWVSQQIDCRAYKPVASGVQSSPSDIDRLWCASGNAGTRDDVCPQAFQLPVAPEQAAAAEGSKVDDTLLRQGLCPHMHADVVLIEGAGGLFSPLSHQTLNADLARDFQIPVVIVDSSRLGAIGRTLTTVTAAESVGLTVSAVVLSQSESGHHGDTQKPESPEVIARQSRAELQRRLPHIVVCSLGYDASTIEPFVEWQGIASQLSMPSKPQF
jgi:dethiobiotin synthetase